MRFDRLTHRRRPLFVAGVLTAAAVTAALSVPAYAGTSGPTAAASRSAAPFSSATVSGRTVAGALYGAAATHAAGAAASHFLKLHRQMVADVHAAKTKTEPQGVTHPVAAHKLHYWWGSFPDTNSGPGVTATQSISQTLRLTDPSDILYAPTMTPANNSCIEVVTVHTTRTPQIWAWDWCEHIRPVAVVPVDAAFMKDYTTIANGRTAYTTEDVQTNAKNNTWTAYLFNYVTGHWDRLYSQAGTDKSGLTFGWDMFEFYSSTNPSTGSTYVCGDLENAGTQIESSNISIMHDGSWTPASSSDSSWNPKLHPNPAAYKCPDIKFNTVQLNSDWMVDVAG
ncbi:MAG TPA: carbohydrate-binding protein [Streptosporangiaceae bacterium]|jgi:hypothetical protein|nr:carbohydrate-binding protein [Streptosporangiaceae bacterium]